MSVDLTRPLKAAIIDHLAASPIVTQFVPADRIYPLSAPANPLFPFIRYGSPITTSWEASCFDGSGVRATLHAFAETTQRYAGEDRALDIAAAIVEAMKSFAPEAIGLMGCDWEGTQCMRDGDEADRWHAWCEFTLTGVQPV